VAKFLLGPEGTAAMPLPMFANAHVALAEFARSVEVIVVPVMWRLGIGLFPRFSSMVGEG
jgi:hypothetical protein